MSAAVIAATLLWPVGAADVSADGASAATTGSVSASTLWVTSPSDASRRLARQPATSAATTVRIDVDTDAPAQRWLGTGAALTDSSRALLATNPAVTRDLFAPGGSGARLNLVRLPLSGTDFSASGAWTWGWDGARAAPTAQARASASYLTSQVLPLQPGLEVMGTPWTAPGPMKTSGSPRGGALMTASVKRYAAMLAAQARWLRGHHVPLRFLTLGNEPRHSSDYASMTMTGEQMAVLGTLVRDELRGSGVGLWAVDHNWSDRSRVTAVLDAAPGVFRGAAFHCYGGTPDQMSGLPVPSMVTECTGTNDGWGSTFWWDARNLVQGPVSAGSTGLMFWNLALDPHGGPTDTASRWGCTTCRGLVTVRSDGSAERAPEFYTAAHLARAARPGARVLPVTVASGIAAVAFANPDGSIGVFGHNGWGSDVVLDAALRSGSRTPSYVVRPGELFTLLLRP